MFKNGFGFVVLEIKGRTLAAAKFLTSGEGAGELVSRADAERHGRPCQTGCHFLLQQDLQAMANKTEQAFASPSPSFPPRKIFAPVLVCRWEGCSRCLLLPVPVMPLLLAGRPGGNGCPERAGEAWADGPVLAAALQPWEGFFLSVPV